MSSSPAAKAVFDREFLTIRSRLVELGAILDRVDRAGGSPVDDPRLGQVLQGLELLASSEPGRAEKLQRLFSLPYDEDWRSQFNL